MTLRSMHRRVIKSCGWREVRRGRRRVGTPFPMMSQREQRVHAKCAYQVCIPSVHIKCAYQVCMPSVYAKCACQLCMEPRTPRANHGTSFYRCLGLSRPISSGDGR